MICILAICCLENISARLVVQGSTSPIELVNDAYNGAFRDLGAVRVGDGNRGRGSFAGIILKGIVLRHGRGAFCALGRGDFQVNVFLRWIQDFPRGVVQTHNAGVLKQLHASVSNSGEFRQYFLLIVRPVDALQFARIGESEVF